MDSQHSPGPWVVDDLGDAFFYETNHKYGIGANSKPTYRIAKVEGLGIESEANARLIAAAPELLAACEAALEELCDVSEDKELIDQLYAVINKTKEN